MSSLLLSAFAAALTFAADPQIRTIAGDGTPVGPSEGVIAEGTPLGAGWAVAFDSGDRLYVALATGEIFRIGDGGKWERLWRAPGASLLFGLAVDSEGRVFTSDLLSHSVYRIDSDGTASVVAGNGVRGTQGDGGPAKLASLDSPIGIAVGASGQLFISESSRIRVVDPAGVIRTFAPGLNAGTISVDSTGNLYLAAFPDAALRRISPDGAVQALAAATSLAVAACANGDVFFTDMYQLWRLRSGAVEVIAGSSDRQFVGDSGAARDARFITPLAVACDSKGRATVYDASAFRLRRVE